jgi:AraC family transcriptional regulator
MMQALGKVRPLSFDLEGRGQPVLQSSRTLWAGIPFEVHDMPASETDWECAPLPGERAITILVEGSRKYFASRREYSTIPGTVIFADGARHKLFPRATGEERAIVFTLPTLDHERMIADGGPESFADLRALPPTKTARSLASAIYAEAADGAQSGSAYARALSDALLHYVLESLPPSPLRVHGRFSEGQRRSILRYIDAHLGSSLTLENLASHAGLRPRQFSTLFREAFGAAPHRFLITRRLERAAHLLTSSRLQLTEVALHVGFASHSHFAAAFRQHYGMSPSRYAKRDQA